MTKTARFSAFSCHRIHRDPALTTNSMGESIFRSSGYRLIEENATQHKNWRAVDLNHSDRPL
jgi:hypothetical protein